MPIQRLRSYSKAIPPPYRGYASFSPLPFTLDSTLWILFYTVSASCGRMKTSGVLLQFKSFLGAWMARSYIRDVSLNYLYGDIPFSISKLKQLE